MLQKHPEKILPKFEQTEVTISVEENIAINEVIHTGSATAGSIIYELGGVDSNDFNLGEESGELTFKVSPDFENAADENTDNVYEVMIIAVNDDGSSAQVLTITVTDSVTVFADASTNISVEENTAITVVIHTAVATGEGTIAYKLISGTDAADFSINSTSGELTFVASPDFENPADADTQNDYEITITADDSISPSVDQTVTINVTDVVTVFADASTNISVEENTAITVVIHTAVATGEGTIAYKLIRHRCS